MEQQSAPVGEPVMLAVASEHLLLQLQGSALEAPFRKRKKISTIFALVKLRDHRRR